MVDKCAAFGCKSGYKRKEEANAEIKITFHKFPLANTELYDRWIKANPCEDFTPSKSSRMCPLHFHPGDFIEKRTDSNAARKRQKSTKLGDALFHCYLTDGVVPSIFSNAPKFLSTNTAYAGEIISATASSRQEQDAHRMNLLQQPFFETHVITTLTAVEIMDKLKN